MATKHAPPHNLGIVSRYYGAEQQVTDDVPLIERATGWRLVALWTAAAIGGWAVVALVVIGLYEGLGWLMALVQ